MFKSILSTATFRQSQITLAGTLINGGLGILFYFAMARFLGPLNLGLLTISIATMTLIADIADLGTNTGLVKFVAANLKDNKDKALRFLKLSLMVKFITWVVVLSIGFLLAPTIATNIFNKIELVIPLRLVMLGVGGVLLFSFATSALQAFQKYFIWSLLNVSTNFFRLVVILVFFAGSYLNLTTSLLTYITLPFFGFLFGLAFLPARKIFSAKNEFNLIGNFFKFNLWIAGFSIIAALSSRLDIFLSARLLSASEVGIYGLASQLVQIVPQIIGALGVVVSPKFAGFQNNKDMLTYFKKFQLLVLGVAAAGVLAIPFCVYLIPLIYGLEYTLSVGPFIVLLLATLVFLISIPTHNSIIFYFGKPEVFLWLSLFHLFLVGILGYFMISTYGIMGAAVTVFVGNIFNLLTPLIWFLNKIRK